ncbi:SKP1-like protein 4 [Linum grandiflorum]
MGTYCAIPLDNITGSILSKVIKYCRMHTEAAAEADKLRRWDMVRLEEACAPHEIQAIIKIPIGPHGCKDKWAWKHTRDGRFLVKSAYAQVHRVAEASGSNICSMTE